MAHTGSIRPTPLRSTVTGLLRRAWLELSAPPVPDPFELADRDLRLSPDELWRLRMERVQAMLEQARTIVERDGFTASAWFTVAGPGGSRRVQMPEALRLRHPRAAVQSACLVGTLVRLADDPDSAPSVADAWGCVDELFEALQERDGHASMPPGWVSPPAERRWRVQLLTAFNDAPGRTREDLLDVVDRAIARTIVASCR